MGAPANAGDNGAIRIGDFNGDGKQDLYFHWSDGNDWVGLSTGTGFAWKVFSTSWASDLGVDLDQGALRIGDFNGDGKSDVYFHWQDGSDWVGMSTGSSFVWRVFSHQFPLNLGTNLNQGALRIGDFNGDGKSDVYFHWSDGNHWVGLSTGSAFTWHVFSNQWAFNLGIDLDQAALKIGDFNGDGKSDVYFHWPDGTHWVGLSTGSALSWSVFSNQWQFRIGDSLNEGALRIGDFNGDGKSDVYFHWPDGAHWVGLSTGSTFVWNVVADQWPFKLGRGLDQGALRVGDFNGDHKSDVSFHWSDGNDWIGRSTGSSLSWGVWSNSWPVELGAPAEYTLGSAGACGDGSFYQIPGQTDLFIGRSLNDQAGCTESQGYHLVLSRMNWAAHTLSPVGTVFHTPQTIMNGAYTVTWAYDPTVISINGENWVAFECRIAGNADACVAPLLPNYQVDASRASLVIRGAGDASSAYSASVPKLVEYNGAIYLYWTMVKIHKANSTFVSLTTRGTQLALGASGRMFAIGRSGPVASNDPSTVEVLGVDPNDPRSNTTADSYQAFATGGYVYLVSAKGGSGCVGPFQLQPGCYRMNISRTTNPLGFHAFNSETISESLLPQSGAGYGHFTRTPNGRYGMLTYLFPNGTANTPYGYYMLDIHDPFLVDLP